MRTKYEIPMKLPSCANLREHWAARAKRAKAHREAGRWVAGVNLIGVRIPPTAKITVTLTRRAPRALDSDNLAGAFKATRDGIADALGIDDGSPRIEWRYGQAKGLPAALVEIDVR